MSTSWTRATPYAREAYQREREPLQALAEERERRHKAELAALEAQMQAKLEALRPYLTLHAWVDRKVIAPNAVPAMVGRAYTSWGEIKLAYPERAGSKAPDFERIPVQGGRIVGRAPVALAWATGGATR